MVSLVAGQQHASELLLHGGGRPTREGLEGGDLARAEIQGVTRLGGGQGLGLVAREGELPEVLQAPRAFQLAESLHLSIGGDQLTCHDLFGQDLRRRLDQEGDGEGQIPLRDALYADIDELSARDALLVAGGESRVCQDLIRRRLSPGGIGETEAQHARGRRPSHQDSST